MIFKERLSTISGVRQPFKYKKQKAKSSWQNIGLPQVDIGGYFVDQNPTTLLIWRGVILSFQDSREKILPLCTFLTSRPKVCDPGETIRFSCPGFCILKRERHREVLKLFTQHSCISFLFVL